MTRDQALLEQHRSFRDERLGIAERFVDLEVETGRTLGVLALPLGPARPLGWVQCHSFGNEQVDLSITDTTIARRLSSRGFPVLRFHCRGYGDAGDLELSPGPGTHLSDTLRVLEQAPALLGTSRIGTLGARFGATVAALAAERAALSDLAMIEPITRGSAFVSELLRYQVVGTLAGGEAATVEELRSELAHRGAVNVQGWVVPAGVVAELEGLDLTRALARLSARTLLVQVSRSAKGDPVLAALAAHLGHLGTEVELRIVADRSAPHFGYEHFQATSPTTIADTMMALNEALADTVTTWAEEAD